MIRRFSILGLMVAGALLLTLFFVACGSSNTTTKTTAPATINLTLSDPATCSASASTGGIYQAIFIAITDVQINASGSAGDNDPNWLDLTPNLTASKVPIQVNLLDLPNPQCFLASLGSTTAIPPGTYQQMRIFLADNTADNAKLISGNKCDGAATPAVNCVILPPPNTATPQPLLLSSEVKNGIKIPSGQIAGGQFTIAAGETKDLDIDVNACGSVVQVVAQGNMQFRLKPVLHAGEVSLTSSSVNGTLVDASGKPLTGVKAIVTLEQRNAPGTPDTFFMDTTTDSNGNFNFCPVPNGTYDVVAAVVNSTSNPAFAATITTGVTPGKNLGNITMNTVSGTTAVKLSGDVTTAGGSGGIEEQVVLSALQQVTIGSSSTAFIIPASEITQSTARTVVTAKTCTSTTCPTFSATYDLVVPPGNPTTGAFVAGTTTKYTAGQAGSPSYVVEGDAFKPTSGDTPTRTCTPPTMQSATISLTSGTTSVTVPTLVFSGCS